EPAVAVAEAVPAQLPVDGGRVAAEPGRDLADRGAGLDEAEEGATLVEVEVAVGPGQGRLRRASPRKGWGFALRDRTHRRPPGGRLRRLRGPRRGRDGDAGLLLGARAPVLLRDPRRLPGAGRGR